jgi:DNA-binding CsgD family transcriptional regulator
MRQLFLPGFPDGAEKIGGALSILTKDRTVTYFVGSDNYFSHEEGDRKGQRFALTNLMVNEHVRAAEIERSSLGIAHRTLMNWMAQYRKAGPGSFFAVAAPQKPRVMTAEKIAECSSLLAAGHRPAAVARLAGIGESTLRKAIARKLIVPSQVFASEGSDQASASEGSTKGERSRIDAQAAQGLGTACLRADERIAAALGLMQSASTRYECAADVSLGGLLVGLPALCANGLLSGIDKHLKLPAGFYSCLQILLTLGFMALSRIRRPEGLRHIPPGELGKVIGLDRVPEVRTLREKITFMASTGNPQAWMQELSKTWMEADPSEAGYLYIDGHVRVYHGEQAVLPRRYVSRERLCLRGTTDYWINDALGRPFFVVSKAITAGLGDTLLRDIVPQLLVSVPGQPTAEQLHSDPRLHRFVIICDREGATASLLRPLWQQRIGAITYRKNVKDLWPESEFTATEVAMPDGVRTTMKLAMRETQLGENLPVKEVRRLTQTGHQSAVISTAHNLDHVMIAGRMFSRWCQENFFAYMMQHYDIDGLVQYGTQEIPGTEMIINPSWRQLDKQVSTARQQLRKLHAKLGACASLGAGAEIQHNAECLLDIEAATAVLDDLRAKRKATARKVTLESLPQQDRPTQLLPLNKVLCDTVKMIAYRAETALVAILRRHLKKEEEARALVREIFVSSADIAPDAQAKTLTVRIHRMASPVHDRAIDSLLKDLNELDFRHPETGDKMIYSMV